MLLFVLCFHLFIYILNLHLADAKEPFFWGGGGGGVEWVDRK